MERLPRWWVGPRRRVLAWQPIRVGRRRSRRIPLLAGGNAELADKRERFMLQDLVRAETDEAIDAGRYGRRGTRRSGHNGHRICPLAIVTSDARTLSASDTFRI